MPSEQRQGVEAALVKFCDQIVPQRDRATRRLEHRWQGNSILLLEKRVHLDKPGLWGECPIAKFRYDECKGDWTLHWLGQEQQWHHYAEIPRVKNIARLLSEVAQDPSGAFWG